MTLASSAIPLLEPVRTALGRLGRDYTPTDVAQAVRDHGAVVSDQVVLELLALLRSTSVGAGPLQGLLARPGVTDVLVNGPEQVFVDAGAGLERVDLGFADDEQVRALATRLAAAVGRRLDEANPWVDARLPDGTRVHAVLGCLAAPGTCISLRVPARSVLTMAQLRDQGSIGPITELTLRALISRRAAYLISGGTGSGKTTLLAALLSLVPVDERIVVVEDSRELSPSHPHVVRLEGRVANAEGVGRISLTDLVRQALRMRPDRLVLGEARGAEVADLLQALNTGHEGGCGTIHANSAVDVPARLEALSALGGLSRVACHAQIASALQLVVHVGRAAGHRRVEQIGVVRRRGRGVRVVPALIQHADGTEQAGPGWSELASLLDLESGDWSTTHPTGAATPRRLLVREES